MKRVPMPIDDFDNIFEDVTSEGPEKPEGTPSKEEAGDDVVRLQRLFHDTKVRYYRHVLRAQDELILKRIQKIPDDWDKFDRSKNSIIVNLTDDQKYRLSDIKKRKAWEIKFESLFVSFFITIEEAVISSLHHRYLSDEDCSEAVDSINSILTELGGNLVNFKHLLISQAKRAVNDFYYLMIAMRKFKKKEQSGFETAFPEFCRDLLNLFLEYRVIRSNITLFSEARRFIKPYFLESSNSRGWKLNDSKMKDYIEGEGSFAYSMEDLKSLAFAAGKIKKRLKSDHDFLRYYYNDVDGKCFRYNFITESLEQKHGDGSISSDAFKKFKDIRDSFAELNRRVLFDGLAGFGPPGMTYLELVDFMFRLCKMVEFSYLRSSRYEALQDFRNRLLHYVEQEYYHLNPGHNRL